jgi:hypothetical protein
MDYFVTIKVYDVLGREVATLIPPLGGGEEGLSMHEVEFNAGNLSSGIYFYKMEVTSGGSVNYSESKKMLLIK